MLWYTGSVNGITTDHLLGLVGLENCNVQVQVHHNIDGTKLESLAAYILESVSWVTHSIRTIAVLFVGGMSAWLFLQRGQVAFRKLPGALVSIVALFFILHVPYLVIDPLCDANVIDVERHPMLPSVAKLIMFSTGAVVSLLMGLSVASIDDFFHIERRWSSDHATKMAFRHDEFFVLSDSPAHGRRRRM
ncbi:Aste57867_14933 [Aphanomyces stellatus]|uniref:Aste57867_14933 protein n=1 Tax=Aphanomyces stellatus TaxID=120398 RepID=A0A485L1Y6_9STRA|nr:hypothetical protein As57867_014877 [Aphanomyces stellatus]VFT91748.1 Aste57867_14933 [Aphanomyces stellatus]